MAAVFFYWYYQKTCQNICILYIYNIIFSKHLCI